MAASRSIFLPFGEFKPDAGHLLSNGLVTASGVVPVGDKFLPLPPMYSRSDRISGDILQINRANVHPSPPFGTEVQVYVVNGDKCYAVDTATTPWTVNELTVGSGTVGIDADSGSMFSFGQHEIIVQGHTNDILYRDKGAGNLNQLITPRASPKAYSTRPKAKFGCCIGDRVLFGNIIDGFLPKAETPPVTPPNGETMVPNPNPDMIWWTKSRDASILRDETDPLDGRSGYTFLYDDHGPIMGLAGDKEYALIFKRRAIYRMDFTGAFGNTYRCIPQSYGTLSHRTIARMGNDVYFWSDSGPCVYRNDQVFQLSAGKISAFLTGNTITRVTQSISAFYGTCVDIANQTVTWQFSYVPDDTPSNTYFMLLTYNAMTDTFSVPFNIHFGPSLSFFSPDNVEVRATPLVLFDGLPEQSPKACFTGALMLCDIYPTNGVPPQDAVRLFSFDFHPEDAELSRWWNQDIILKTGFYALGSLNAQGSQNSVLVKKIRPVVRATSEAALPELSVRVWTKQKPWDDPTDTLGYKSLSTAGDARGFISTLGSRGAQFQQFELKVPRYALIDSVARYSSALVEIEGLEIEYEEKSPNL